MSASGTTIGLEADAPYDPLPTAEPGPGAVRNGHLPRLLACLGAFANIIVFYISLGTRSPWFGVLRSGVGPGESESVTGLATSSCKNLNGRTALLACLRPSAADVSRHETLRNDAPLPRNAGGLPHEKWTLENGL